MEIKRENANIGTTDLHWICATNAKKLSFKTVTRHAHPQNLFTCLFSTDKANNMNNFIVKNTITIWKKIKHNLQEPISVPKKNNPMEQYLDSFSEFTDKLVCMENYRHRNRQLIGNRK